MVNGTGSSDDVLSRMYDLVPFDALAEGTPCSANWQEVRREAYKDQNYTWSDTVKQRPRCRYKMTFETIPIFATLPMVGSFRTFKPEALAADLELSGTLYFELQN